ncbi:MULTISPECIES: hypothetical protein [unclassified Synechococcus]|uniref:hypothetical protein n=1 Tax=unclassified Synechococcus TaxID=2626047 RepID=UPI001C22EB21|nr:MULTISPECIES: hypothetical protein [unclassified Synechococcus]
MADTPAPLTGDPEIDALLAEIDGCLAEWDLLIDEQLEITRRLGDLAAIDAEFLL